MGGQVQQKFAGMTTGEFWQLVGMCIPSSATIEVAEIEVAALGLDIALMRALRHVRRFARNVLLKSLWYLIYKI